MSTRGFCEPAAITIPRVSYTSRADSPSNAYVVAFMSLSGAEPRRVERSVMQHPSEGTDVSEPIEVPDFLVGQDGEGHWLAVETHGLGGGIFVTRDAALDYARAETRRRVGAVHLAPSPLTLR